MLRTGAVLLAAFLLLTPLGSTANAQSAQEFQASPKVMLANFTDGGARMIALVRQFAATPANLALIVGLLADANPQQANAIGTGLGQAWMVANTSNKAYAEQIRVAVLAANNTIATAAFSAASGSATAAGAGEGGGGGGGGGGAGPTTPGAGNGPITSANGGAGTPPSGGVPSGSGPPGVVGVGGGGGGGGVNDVGLLNAIIGNVSPIR
jgi:hypothetical protein